MKKITIINIEDNSMVEEFTTRKRNFGLIQDEVVEHLGKKFNGRVWLQGAIKLFGSGLNSCLLNGNLYWIVSGKEGKFQFTIE